MVPILLSTVSEALHGADPAFLSYFTSYHCHLSHDSSGPGLPYSLENIPSSSHLSFFSLLALPPRSSESQLLFIAQGSALRSSPQTGPPLPPHLDRTPRVSKLCLSYLFVNLPVLSSIWAETSPASSISMSPAHGKAPRTLKVLIKYLLCDG